MVHIWCCLKEQIFKDLIFIHQLLPVHHLHWYTRFKPQLLCPQVELWTWMHSFFQNLSGRLLLWTSSGLRCSTELFLARTHHDAHTRTPGTVILRRSNGLYMTWRDSPHSCSMVRSFPNCDQARTKVNKDKSKLFASMCISRGDDPYLGPPNIFCLWFCCQALLPLWHFEVREIALKLEWR